VAKTDPGLRMIHHPRTPAPHSRLKLAGALICVSIALCVGAVAAEAVPQYRGAQVHSLWPTVSTAEMTEELNALQGAGVNVLRVDVGWATMEYARGQYDPAYLAKLDALASGAQARGIKLIATLWQTPSWASSGGAWNDAPSNPADYGAFARFIASRYGSELAAVEAWNEPEINGNLIASNLPAAYTQMVKSFYAGAKEGDPSVAVLAGSLSYADVSFLQALYANGIQGFYDGISMHPYADGAAPANTAVTHSFLGGIEALHAAQLAAGDNTPEWVTEFGWPTGTSRGANTEQQQAEYTEQGFALVDDLSYVEGATAYELRDMETNAADPEDNFGMLRQDFTPTPAYAALKAAMQVVPGTAQDPPTSFREGAPETGSGKEAGAGSGAGGGAQAPQAGASEEARAPQTGAYEAGTSSSSPPFKAPSAHTLHASGAHGFLDRRAQIASIRSHRSARSHHLVRPHRSARSHRHRRVRQHHS
jgi:polysaccharide biosynthesis protein PslG